MRLAFAELGVRELAASVAWYQSTLGLTVELLDAPRGFALLLDGFGNRIAFKQGTPGAVRWQFEVQDLEAELQRLTKAGIPIDSDIQTSSEGYRKVVLRDPDGNAVSLFEWLSCG